MDIAGMEHLTHFWALVYVTCNVWSNTFVCGCTHTVFSLERWHSFVKWGFCFVPEALVSQLETDEWNAHWVDETHKVRKQRYNSCEKHVVLVCVFSCAGLWALLWQEAQSVRECLHRGSAVSAFTPSTSGPCLENIVFLWWGQEEISGCHWEQTKTQSYTWKIYFDWLIEFSAEEITGSDHSSMYHMIAFVTQHPWNQNYVLQRINGDCLE